LPASSEPPASPGAFTPSPSEKRGPLRVVKMLHSVVWALFVASILGVWAAAWIGRFTMAFACIGVVTVEIVILLLNGWKCPLTAIAARYTPDRRANFDIYLPEWLARYNKEIFGSLFFGGLLYTVARWQGWLG